MNHQNIISTEKYRVQYPPISPVCGGPDQIIHEGLSYADAITVAMQTANADGMCYLVCITSDNDGTRTKTSAVMHCYRADRPIEFVFSTSVTLENGND